MTQEQLENLIRSACSQVGGDPGALEFEFEEVAMACLSDITFDRMRLIAPIVEVQDLDSEDLLLVLEANFHTALDARYASSEGTLYAAFLHPLGSLAEPDAYSALQQVASLVKSFGTTFSSGHLVFGSSSSVVH